MASSRFGGLLSFLLIMEHGGAQVFADGLPVLGEGFCVGGLFFENPFEFRQWLSARFLV